MAGLVPRVFINFCGPVAVNIERLAKGGPGSGTLVPGKGFFGVFGCPRLKYPRFYKNLIDLKIYTAPYT